MLFTSYSLFRNDFTHLVHEEEKLGAFPVAAYLAFGDAVGFPMQTKRYRDHREVQRIGNPDANLAQE